MNKSIDRAIAEWLHEGPESGPRDGLERALAATRRVGQRPGWTLPERWLPMQLTLTRPTFLRPGLVLASLALLLALLATAAIIGMERPDPPLSFRNGPIVYQRDGELYIADQLHGEPRLWPAVSAIFGRGPSPRRVIASPTCGTAT